MLLECTLISYLTSFEGRAGRISYIGFTAISALIISIVFYILQLRWAYEDVNPFTILFDTIAIISIVCIAVLSLVASFAVTFRRLHDIGVSGIWCFLGFLTPIFGGIINEYSKDFTVAQLGWDAYDIISIIIYLLFSFSFEIFLLLWPGTKGDNRYGEPVPFRPFWTTHKEDTP